MQERLQKVLAKAGIGSRRYCEELIERGVVTVNGCVVVELGTKVNSEKDTVHVHGKPIKKESHVYLVLYKPKGYLCTNSDIRGRPTVFSLIQGIPQRLFTVGRLDKDTEGLLLITNDGDFKNKILHPSRTIPKVYHVILSGTITQASLKKLERGMMLDGRKTMPVRINRSHTVNKSKRFIEIVLYEGKKRQIKRMFSSLGCTVASLKRVKIGNLDLSGLRPGKYRLLKKCEIESLIS